MDNRDVCKLLAKLSEAVRSIADELREGRPDSFRDDLPVEWRPFEFSADLPGTDTVSPEQLNAFRTAAQAHCEARKRCDPLEGAKLIASHIRAAIGDAMSIIEHEAGRKAFAELHTAHTALEEAITIAKLEQSTAKARNGRPK